MKESIQVADQAMGVAADMLEHQQARIEALNEVLQQLVKDRDGWRQTAIDAANVGKKWQEVAQSNGNAALEWKGLSEHLQAQFAMLEQRGAVH